MLPKFIEGYAFCDVFALPDPPLDYKQNITLKLFGYPNSVFLRVSIKVKYKYISDHSQHPLLFKDFLEGYGIIPVLRIRREYIMNSRHRPRCHVTQL